MHTQLSTKGQEIFGYELRVASSEAAGGNTLKTIDTLDGEGPSAVHISIEGEQTVRDPGGPPGGCAKR